MGYQTTVKTDVDSVIPEEAGGMWFLKESLETDQLGVTALELEPGVEGQEHDEADSGQEEVYYVVEGQVDVDMPEETVTLSADEAIRLDPGTTRKLHNSGDERAKLVLAGAPL